jgi:hypothetical protein
MQRGIKIALLTVSDTNGNVKETTQGTSGGTNKREIWFVQRVVEFTFKIERVLDPGDSGIDAIPTIAILRNCGHDCGGHEDMKMALQLCQMVRIRKLRLRAMTM